MVSARHRRRGIGTALLREAEEWARAVGVRKLELHVFPHNDAALQLYESCGFRREASARPLPPRRGVPRRGADGARRPLDSASGHSPRSPTAFSSRRFATSSRTSRASPSRKSSESSARAGGEAGVERGPFGPFPEAIDALAAAAPELNRYPDGGGYRPGRPSPRGTAFASRRSRSAPAPTASSTRSRRSRSSRETRSSAAGRASPAM